MSLDSYCKKYLLSKIDFKIYRDLYSILKINQKNELLNVKTRLQKKINRMKHYIAHEFDGIKDILYFLFKEILLVRKTRIENEKEFINLLFCVCFVHNNPSEYIDNLHETFHNISYDKLLLINKIIKGKDKLKIECRLESIIFDILPRNSCLNLTLFEEFMDVVINMNGPEIHKKILGFLEQDLNMIQAIMNTTLETKSISCILKRIVDEKDNYENNHRELMAIIELKFQDLHYKCSQEL